MKHAKKWLAALLAVALLAGGGVSAAAGDEDLPPPINWDDFYIVSPATGSVELEVPFGSDFTLSIEANVPDGLEVEYGWKPLNSVAPNTPYEPGSTFHCTPEHPWYPHKALKPYMSATVEIYKGFVAVTQRADDGHVVRTEARSREFYVTILPEREPTAAERFYYRWIFAPFLEATFIGVMTYGAGFLVFPLVWLYYAIFEPSTI